MSSTTTQPAPATGQAPAATALADQVVATLVVAFAADPIIRWLLPDSTRYLAGFAAMVRLAGQSAFADGTADLAPGGAGAALWLRPGVALPEEPVAELLQRSLDAERHGEAFDLLAQMDEHHPTEPHWYLPFIGVDPRYQGRGFGSALLRTGLARCDRDGVPAYLEASSPLNRALYERHGFTAVAEVRAADAPPLWPMLRPAR